MKRLLSGALAAAMMLTMAAAPVSAETAAEKYTVQHVEDGDFYRVTNPNGGKTLSYKDVELIEVTEGSYTYAFKDLNKNGQLDVYEDWRLSAVERATNLAEIMANDGEKGIAAIAGLMLYSAHTTVATPEIEGSTTTSTSTDASTTMDAITANNIRHILVTTVATPEIGAQWNNNVQALCESIDYGIPANNSSDPRHEASSAQTSEYVNGNAGSISLWPSGLGLAATFDAEIVKEFGQVASTEYRALGISTALSPQIDLATEPRWSRVNGTFGENSQLSADMARAYVDGFQTTEGSETGWGANSVNAMIKHWPSGGPEEGGRDGHYGYGKFAVYPGNNFDEHMVPFTEGALKLDGATGMASAVMPYYTVSYDQDTENGENVGNGYSQYVLTTLLREKYKFDGVLCTDWMITADAANDAAFTGKNWGVEDITVTERHYKALMAGMDQFGGNNLIAPVVGAYDMMVKADGEEFAKTRFATSARRLLTNIFNGNLFEDAYLVPSESTAIVGNADYMQKGYEAQLKSIVMLKNDGIITKYDDAQEKKTVYVPEYEFVNFNWWTGESSSEIKPTVSTELLSKYYNVTSDPAEADFAIVGMSTPSTGSGYSEEDKAAGGNGYVPISLQYREYTADTARETAIANDPGRTYINSETGEANYVDDVANRSYKGKSTKATNEGLLDLLEKTKADMGDKPVVVYMNASNPMVWSEVEPLVNAIVLGYSVQDQAAIEVIAGVTEPSGLLPMQQPKDMITVEAQYEDVPQDMECYVDAAGNSYDFAYGLNWSGVISDARTQKYASK